MTLTIKLARADPQGRGPAPTKGRGRWTEKLIWNVGDVTTFPAVLQSRELEAELDQASSEIRTDINRVLQTFVDCLQAASACMIKKIKSGGCRKSAKWFDKECYDYRKLARSKLRQYRRTKRSDREMYVEARKEYRALLKLKTIFFRKWKGTISFRKPIQCKIVSVRTESMQWAREKAVREQ